MPLTNKVVLITGANGGLGTAVTKAFLEAGARVAGVAKKIQDSDFPHPNFIAYSAELGSAEAARAVAASVIAKWEKIDVLVHLVGGFAGGRSVADTDDATLEQMLEVNLRAAFHMFRAVLPDMRARGAWAASWRSAAAPLWTRNPWPGPTRRRRRRWFRWFVPSRSRTKTAGFPPM